MTSAVYREDRKHALQPLIPSLYVGASTGFIGGTVGTAVGTLQGRNALISGVAAGGQAFVIGTTFWYTRSLLKLAHDDDQITAPRQTFYSTISGSVAGAAAGALVGRRHVLPGALMMGAFGGTGQIVFTIFANRYDPNHVSRPMLDRLSDTSWWPLKSLPDGEYEKMLNDKIGIIDAQIADIDTRIAQLETDKTRQT